MAGRHLSGALALVAALGVAGGASAAVTTYSGYDPGASAPGALATAAAAAFDAATPGASVITWETSALGDTNGTSPAAGVTLSSSGFEILAATTCGAVLCGDNTTSGGSHFAYSNASDAFLTFSFTTPTNLFGAFFGGLQTASSQIEFSDGTSQVIPIPTNGVSSGGFAFVGFTSTVGITSVKVNIPFDLISVDDVRYGAATVGGIPEASTWAMMLLGFGGLGAVLRGRRRSHAAVA